MSRVADGAAPPDSGGDATPRYCLKCRTLAAPGDKRCSWCGARFRPVPYRGLVYLALLAGLAALLAVGVDRLWAAAREQGHLEAVKRATPKPRPSAGSSSTTAAPDTSTTPTTAPPAPEPLTPATIEASATAGASRNSCGDVTTYEAAKALDGDPSTTWRVRGDGSGQSLTFTFAKPVRVTKVGVVPGYVKTDPCSGANRYDELRRLVNVTWQFDGGLATPQTLDPTSPAMQTVDVNVVTTKVTLEIDKVTPSGGIDFTPVSEVTLVGVPAA